MSPVATCLDDYRAALLANGAPPAVCQRRQGNRIVCDVWPKGCVFLLPASIVTIVGVPAKRLEYERIVSYRANELYERNNTVSI